MNARTAELHVAGLVAAHALICLRMTPMDSSFSPPLCCRCGCSVLTSKGLILLPRDTSMPPSLICFCCYVTFPYLREDNSMLVRFSRPNTCAASSQDGSSHTVLYVEQLVDTRVLISTEKSPLPSAQPGLRQLPLPASSSWTWPDIGDIFLVLYLGFGLLGFVLLVIDFFKWLCG